MKAIRRDKYREVEKNKCWEKHLALEAAKNEDMVTDGGCLLEYFTASLLVVCIVTEIGGVVDHIATEKPTEPSNDVEMDSTTQISRKQLLKSVKIKTTSRRIKKKLKRLGGKHSLSKW